jgi:predicted O-methyltransferase YrrM
MLAVLGVPAAGPLALAQRRGIGRSQDSSFPLAKNDVEKKILDVLAEAARTGDVYLEVPNSDGRMLRLLTEAAGAKSVVEVGTSTGYSGLWLLLALHKTGGKLTTFELDAGRAADARKHFAQAGVGGLATVIEGDAHENVKRLKDPIDVLFIDADKDGYPDYLNKLSPLVRPGGLILAHNFDQAAAYGRAVTGNPDLETLVPGGSLAITLKKR